MDKKYSYFQFQKEADLPVFVKVDLTQFETSLMPFLNQTGFTELSEKESKDVYSKLATSPFSRILTLEEATFSVARQIDRVSESDRFGLESIIPKDGYRVYRYKGEALMVYSVTHREWKMGAFPGFGDAEKILAYRSIMNRFLSWALAPLGIVGFWGVPVDEGMVVLKQKDSQAEAVFIDVKNRRQFSIDGVKRLSHRFKILRLDPNLKNRNIRMSPEELLSFLSLHCSYFDIQGQSVPVRQMIQSLSRLFEGLNHPKESFKPRTDLSL